MRMCPVLSFGAIVDSGGVAVCGKIRDSSSTAFSGFDSIGMACVEGAAFLDGEGDRITVCPASVASGPSLLGRILSLGVNRAKGAEGVGPL